MIIVKNVSLSLNGKSILSDIHVTIPKGRITVFLGSSGAGKTSLIKCVAQVYTQYAGDILLHDHDVKKLSALQRAQKMGFVFQHGYLFPHLNVLNNCAQPQVINGVAFDIACKNAIGKLEELHI
jgi:ABC-type sulfate/molybdate transport systems ATPase subunit